MLTSEEEVVLFAQYSEEEGVKKEWTDFCVDGFISIVLQMQGQGLLF